MPEVVRTAQQADVPSIGYAEPGKGCYVVQFEQRPRGAASTIGRYERALTAGSTMNFSPHCHGHVPSTFADLRRARLARSGFGYS